MCLACERTVIRSNRNRLRISFPILNCNTDYYYYYYYYYYYCILFYFGEELTGVLSTYVNFVVHSLKDSHRSHVCNTRLVNSISFKILDVVIVCLRIKFDISSSNGSLVIVMKPKTTMYIINTDSVELLCC
jgi:hypothetical protein